MKDDSLKRLLDREIWEYGKKLKKGEIERNIESMNALNRLLNTRIRFMELSGMAKTEEDDLQALHPDGRPRGFMRSGAYTN